MFIIQLQGGKTFLEKIRTKIRTFSEEIRTIFEKKSVQSVQFSKKIPAIRTFQKNKTIFENIIQQCLSYKT